MTMDQIYNSKQLKECSGKGDGTRLSNISMCNNTRNVGEFL